MVRRADGAGRYPGDPAVVGEGDTLEAASLTGLRVEVDALLHEVPTQ